MVEILTLDMHTHLNEKKTKPKAFWERVQEIGLSGVAITEHANFNPGLAFEKLEAERPEGIFLIPGMEINCASGHMLAFSSTPELYEIEALRGKNVSLEKLLEERDRHGFLLAVAHPWGLSYDSIGYAFGADAIEELVQENGLGVETYNGMIGHLSNFIYDSNWVRKPVNFFDFLEKNRVARKTGLARLGRGMKSRIDKRCFDVIHRCAKAVELGSVASFVTAGSDAHSAERIGSGILKIKTGRAVDSVEALLEEIRKKEQVIWAGPLVREIKKGVYEKIDDPLRRKEIIQGVGYAARKAIGRVSLKEKIVSRLHRKKKKSKQVP
ncbi:MAG: PHP-associated domain-containing protein [Candidatus Diapherotrites archaeon]